MNDSKLIIIYGNTHLESRANKSCRYCDVRIAYKYGSAQEFSGQKKTNKILDSVTLINGQPARAVSPKKASGDQHVKLVNTYRSVNCLQLISSCVFQIIIKQTYQKYHFLRNTYLAWIVIAGVTSFMTQRKINLRIAYCNDCKGQKV